METVLTRRLSLDLPLIQAPMAGGVTTVDLVAAVCAAGALGCFGFAYTAPDRMLAEIGALRERTDRPFGLNLFTHPPAQDVSPARKRAALAALAPAYRAVGLAPPESLAPPYAPPLDEQLDAALKARPALFSFHFHPPPAAVVARFQAAGCLVAGSATTLAEGEALAALGVDAVIAQGWEAGGHRASFLADPQAPGDPTLTLVETLSRRLAVPVIAAGGLMDGAGIAAALGAGAAAAQLGTAFLACPESGAPAVHKAMLAEAARRGTAMTRAVSGRPARAVVTGFVRAWQATPPPGPILPFPIQNAATGPLRRAAADRGDGEQYACWAGTAAAAARSLPAADLVACLHRETATALAPPPPG